MDETMENEFITSKKKAPEITNRSNFSGFQLEAGGKPSTWFPPGGLVEPTPLSQSPRNYFKMPR